MKKNLEYLKKDFSNLSKNEIYKFKYISNILLNDDTIDKKRTLDDIKNFVEGKPIEKIEDLKAVIEKRNKAEEHGLKLKTTFIDYKIGFIFLDILFFVYLGIRIILAFKKINSLIIFYLIVITII